MKVALLEMVVGLHLVHSKPNFFELAVRILEERSEAPPFLSLLAGPFLAGRRSEVAQIDARDKPGNREGKLGEGGICSIFQERHQDARI